MPLSGPPTRHVSKPRVLFYSHDSVGLGHLRRSLTLAEALRGELPEAAIVVATGSAAVSAFRRHPGVDLVKLPCIGKDEEGRYAPRELPLPLASVLGLRRALLLQLVRSYRPHVLVVDHKVRGLCGELDEVLPAARAMGTRTILGLRDILDDPATVAREWGGRRTRRALTHAYDRVLLYGAPEVFDPRREYPIPPELSERMEFVGYVVRPHEPGPMSALPRTRDEVLVTVGGGDDGRALMHTYLESVEAASPPWASMLCLGPLFDPREARRLKRRARGLEHVRVHHFYDDMPRLLEGCSAVVSMAGYNSAVEVVRSGRPAIFVPRTFPRREQLIRAETFAERGMATCLPDPSAQALGQAVRAAVSAGPRQRACPLPLDGAAGFAAVVAEELSVGRPGAIRAKEVGG